jgi:hypothetical protein
MSRAALTEILDRSLLEEDFRRAILADPEGVLDGFDLTDEERSALLSRQLTKVADLAFLACTIRFAMIRNIVALLPPLDDSRGAELQRRGDEIARMEGNLTEHIKEFLARMR